MFGDYQAGVCLTAISLYVRVLRIISIIFDYDLDKRMSLCYIVGSMKKTTNFWEFGVGPKKSILSVVVMTALGILWAIFVLPIIFIMNLL